MPGDKIHTENIISKEFSVESNPHTANDEIYTENRNSDEFSVDSSSCQTCRRTSSHCDDTPRLRTSSYLRMSSHVIATNLRRSSFLSNDEISTEKRNSDGCCIENGYCMAGDKINTVNMRIVFCGEQLLHG